MILVIGNKRYSSWSLRPWLLMKHFEIPFQEKLIALDQPQTRTEILKVSPSGKVPALVDGAVTIWESLAIMEYLNEKFPDKNMWPVQKEKRAMARCISNEMHGGFLTMRNHMPHDLKSHFPRFDVSPAQADVDRVQEVWTKCLQDSGGPFLFGEFSIADAMYAPVVNRFITYDVKMQSPDVNAYLQRIRNLPAHQQWIQEALSEELRMPRYEV